MKISSISSLLVSFIVTFLLVGIPYWQIPYSQVSFPNSLFWSGVLVVLTISAIVRIVSLSTFKQASIVVGLAVPACIIARVQFDVSRDPTTHNLWPLEIIIGMGVGFAFSILGSIIGGSLTPFIRSGSGKLDNRQDSKR